MPTDDYLSKYAETGDEGAFRKLAERYSGIVFACAVQHTGSPEAAEEIVQNVFVTLAKSAPRLQNHPALSGWLYKAARNESANFLRRESKRRQKMKDYQAHEQTKIEGQEPESDLVPQLFESLEKLSDAERTLILLRFFEGKSYRDIAPALRKSEAASRKQVERVLTKLGHLLRKRGVATTSATLATVLTAQLTKAAPAAIIESASKGAGIAAASTPTITLTTAMALSPSKLTLLGTAVVWLTVGSASFFAGREQSLRASIVTELAEGGSFDTSNVMTGESIKNDQRALPEPTLERLRFLIRSTKAEHRLLEFRLAVKGLSKAQLVDLAEYAKGKLIYSDEEDRSIAIALLSGLIVQDSEAALAFAETLGPWKNKILPQVIAAWAVADQDAALEWIANAGAGIRGKAFAAVLEKIGDRDREAAITLFRESVESGMVSAQSWDSDDFFREWIKQDPHKAIQEALSMREFTKRDQSVHRALAAWGRFDPNAAARWLHENDGSFGDAFANELIVSLVDGWAERSPTDAAAYLLGIENPKTQERAAHFLLRDWSAQSFDDAKNWIASVEDSHRRQLFEYIIMVAARDYGNREQAIAYGVEKYDTHGGMHHALFLQSDQIMLEDPVAGIEWVREDLPEKLHPLLFAQAMRAIRDMMPEEATNYLHVITNPAAREKQYEWTAQTWAEVDLDAARDWANALPDSTERSRALAGVATEWIDQDPSAVAEWIGDLEIGETRDHLAYRYARDNSANDPMGAIELASSIEHEFRREEALETSMRAWLRSEPDAARAAIEETDSISDTIKWRLLKQ